MEFPFFYGRSHSHRWGKQMKKMTIDFRHSQPAHCENERFFHRFMMLTVC